MTRTIRRIGVAYLTALLYLSLGPPGAAQTTSPTNLADQPVFAGAAVPGNLALVLSVEYPTAISVANIGSYADATTYYGYFDPVKCYSYSYNSTTPSSSYFYPAALSTGANNHFCSGMWSGNFMNWATMQTIDPFRWALTGGYRSVDHDSTQSAPYTILEKAWASFQGGFSVSGGFWNSTSFPFRGTEQNDPNKLPTTPTNLVPLVTPFTNWVNFNSAIWANGNEMVFAGTYNGAQYIGEYTAYTATVSGNNATVTSSATNNVYDLPSNVNAAATLAANHAPLIPNASNQATWRVYVRVSVCDASLGTAYLESNCTKYGSIYKPEGLLQQYSNQMRYADLSYLNSDGQYQQGGVLRAPMFYIGPTYPQPLSSTVVTNTTRAEWSATTGVQSANPDTASATASGVPNSGVINYLNQFGHYTATAASPQGNGGNLTNNNNTYMKNDNVSELYYAAIRYFEALGNVSTWTTLNSNVPGYPTTVQLDGFPAVSTWTDPLIYSCQQNFILGIGDDHTHFDYNVANNGGAADANNAGSPYYRTDPTFTDSINQSYTWTSDVETLEGLTSTPPWWNYYNGGGSYSTYFMAGLAYGAHVNDIRPDNQSVAVTLGTQTISTYWVDVAEYGYPENENQYYLAAKYGGFTIPSGYSFDTPLTQSWWDTSNNSITTHVTGPYSTSLGGTFTTAPQPDNYFLAGQASTMVSSLQSAFANIASAIGAYTTSFSFSQTSVASTAVESFASQYSSAGWVSTVTANSLTFASSGAATSTQLWSTNTTLQTQLAGTGWQAGTSPTGRRIATWNGSAGVAFEPTSISASQQTALTPGSTSYAPTTTYTQYLDYLRGDRTNEVGSTVSGSTRALRARTLLLGDIVDSALTPVTNPNQVFTEANNPGYTAFSTTYASRPTMVYAGANDGMLHGFLGSSGIEQFAYVPSALYQGPTGAPLTNGLLALGNPSYTHHYYVDATPLAFDIDLAKTGGTTGTPNWRTLLIGGLGKGGKSFYALDITNPASGMQTESAVVGNVKWEFTESTMGYSFGAPLVVKTTQYGWVVAFTSGYDNSDGYGHLYLVNPSSGALIQDIVTPSASSGLTQASAFIRDYTDGTADSIYVGDLNGQLWRFDLTTASGSYPAPTLLATLTDSSNNQQPITTAPLIEISPTNRYRYVMVGTGQLLSTGDIAASNMQTFYTILDGTAGGFNAVSTAITRTNLTPVTDVTQGITLSSTSKGWYYDLGTSSGIAWRVVLNPVAYNGIVVFSALLTSGNACSPGGNSEVYAVNYSTATSVLQPIATSPNTPAANYPIGGAVTSEKVFLNNGTPQLDVGTSTIGTPTQIPWNASTSGYTRILNWREIPTAE